MAPRTTRSKANGSAPKLTAESSSVSTTSASKSALQPSSQNPPKVFILPKDTSPEARIVTLSHPRTGDATRYFFCPVKGFHEIKNIAPPKKSQPRSWLLAPEDASRGSKPVNTTDRDESKNEYDATIGYIASDPSLYVATPIDPLFLILSAFEGSCTDEKQRFLASDDHCDELISQSPQMKNLLQHQSVQTWFSDRMGAVCDEVDAGDEKMFRLNQDKLLAVLAKKCRMMVHVGLPASLEDARVRKPLEKPMASIKRGDSSLAEEFPEEDEDGLAAAKLDSLTLKPATVTPEAFSMIAEEPKSVVAEHKKDPIDAPDDITDALRMQTAFQFLISSYIPPKLSSTLAAKLKASASEDATPFPNSAKLSEYLQSVRELREKAAASRSLDHFSNKREFDEERETRAEKKRKLEEEEKAKKKNMTRGVRDLQKVNVSGMKKMSDFFKKKT